MMGNTASGKPRHSSGDDLGPAMNVGKGAMSPQTSLEDSDVYDPIAFKRARAGTFSPGPQQLHEKLLPTVFKWEGGGKEVAIAGSFNGWKQKIPMSKSHGDFFTIVDLREGTHQYKFFVDGQWVHDPNETTVNNDMGSVNNVVLVKKSDFEVFEALDIDSFITDMKKQQADVNWVPPGEYCQAVPPRNTGAKQAGPPVLPPHLLQVILNKDTSVHCEPTLLPEPNHVMLNHLYALSIKDGVMVLSATHRFRKKYVTTLLYKPI